MSQFMTNLGIRLVWSESSLSAWRKLGSLATHWAHSEDSAQTGRMPRLIWIFAGRTVILLVLSWGGSYDTMTQQWSCSKNCFQSNTLLILTRFWSHCVSGFVVMKQVYGPRQANLVLIAYANSEGSGEPAHPRSLARTSAARPYKQWVKRNLQTESQTPDPSEWLGMRS